MSDSRVSSLSQAICKCLDITEDDVVMIWSNEGAIPLVQELQKEILQSNAHPEIRMNFEQLRYGLLKHGNDNQLARFSPGLAREIELATKLISIECITNPSGMRPVDQNKLNIWQQAMEPHYRRLDFIPTVVTRFPNVSYANKAGMGLEEYEKLFYDAVTIDLEELHRKYSPIEQMISRGNHFEIKTSNTHLQFDLGDRNFMMNALLVNLPDGEIFCAPLEDTVNGHIYFEYAPSYQGKVFEDLYLEFSNGQITKAESATQKDELEKILATDEGARKLGEFGIGINPAIPNFTNDLLFDEKVEGTFHIAIGNSYPEVGGTNRSLVRFEMVKDMRKDGEIIMDGRVIYRDGCFVI